MDRDRSIRDARLFGASIREIAEAHNLTERRVKQILKVTGSTHVSWTAQDRFTLAFRRREQRLALFHEILGFARALPNTQASAKTGAFRLASDALKKVTDIEEKSGMLPVDADTVLESLNVSRAAELIERVLRKYDVPDRLLEDMQNAIENPIAISWGVEREDKIDWDSIGKHE